MKIGYATLAADYRYFVGSSELATGGFYLFVGAALTSLSAKYSEIEFDQTKYDIIPSFDNERLTGFGIRVGLGYELNLDGIGIFAEPILTIPATETNGQSVSVLLPPSIGFTAGVHIPLN